MSGAIPPLPQYAFMACCSVKTQGQFYLPFLFTTIWGELFFVQKCKSQLKKGENYVISFKYNV
jgi:hypothetical protein